MDENLSIKRAPENLRKLGIGQVYDARQNKFRPTFCLDLQKLYNKDKLQFSNDEVIEYYSFNDFSTEITDHSVFEIGGGIKGGGLTASLKAAYDYYSEKSKMIKENKLTADIYKVKKVSISLINSEHISGDLHKYMKDSDDGEKLKSDYDDIKKAEGATKRLLIEKFKKNWGTGLITKLELIGGAIGRIEFSSSSTDAKSNTIHEGEMSFESKFVSADGKLHLSDKIGNFNLSVRQTGQVVSFPSEVKSYKDFITQQVEYLRKYIGDKDYKAKAPDFVDDNIRKPISLKDLELTEKPKDDSEKALAALTKDIEKIETNITANPDESLLECIELITKLEADPDKFLKAAMLLKRFESSKIDFKEKFDTFFARIKPLGAPANNTFPSKEMKVMLKIEPQLNIIRNYTLPGEKTTDPRKNLFTKAEIDEVRKFITENKSKPAPPEA